MPGTSQQMRWGRRASIAASLAIAFLASGCSSGGFFGAPSAPAPSASGSPVASTEDRIANFFSGASANARQSVANAAPDVNCPRVDIRQGASTLTIGPPGDNSAMSLQYQGSFERVARQCAVAGGNMVIDVGVEGRVVVGPRGGPGQVSIPLRIAVVLETPGGTRPVVTKFIPIPVVVGPNDGNVRFSHVEQGLSFPLPMPTSLLDNYVVYVGFDPLAAEVRSKETAKPKPKPRHRPRPKPQPAASAN